MKRLFTAFLVAAIFISCTTTQKAQDKTREVMDSWMGHHKSELIQSWGPPQRYESDGKGGEILIYEKKVTRGAVIYGTYHEKTSYPYNMFYADSAGKLYYWRTGS